MNLNYVFSSTKTMVYGMSPYFCPFIVPYCLSVSTRWSNPSNQFLTTYDFDYSVHKSKNHFDSWFSVAVLKLWNSLPLGALWANSLTFFANYLKHTCLNLLFLQINSSFNFLVDFLCWWTGTAHCALNMLNVDWAHY